jgi:hypothetical protein
MIFEVSDFAILYKNDRIDLEDLPVAASRLQICIRNALQRGVPYPRS